MKKILVTGAAGFIGFHLAKKLQQRGDQVVGLDNFNDYYDPILKRRRSEILAKKGIPVIEGDICHLEFLDKIAKEHQLTHVAHMAAQAGVRYSLINPKAYVKANIEGFINVLETCKNHTLKFVFASSSSVYGLNEKIPFSVEDRTDCQASLYGATKKSNELMAFTYHHLYGIPTIGLRFFTVYGPWGRPDMAYFSFTKAIFEEKTIPVFHRGNMQRDFTYIDDIIQGILAAIDLEASYEIFNLGNHQPVELMHFIHLLEKAIGKKAKIEFKPFQPGDVVKTYADITYSQEKLSFFPKTSLEEGIPQFVKWYVDEKTC